MALPIEDYAIIAGLQSAALIGKDGSLDWLCLPRFDSDACFAGLLGTRDNGRWQIAPEGQVTSVHRRYRPGTLILETEFETQDGAVVLIDLMPIAGRGTDVVRIVEGRRGRVPMRMDLVIRCAYGSAIPWVRHGAGGVYAVAGPDALRLWTNVETRGHGFSTVADFSVGPGERVPFVLCWSPSHLPDPGPIDAANALEQSEASWRVWSDRCTVQGPLRALVQRSLITLKGLTYEATGGIVAAATTSLPEEIGGLRNWDYRLCWLRDATLTLSSLLSAGYVDEARSWQSWLQRAAAGEPLPLQIPYWPAGRPRRPGAARGF